MKSRALRIVLWVVVGLAGLVGGFALVGATQPRDHELSRTVELEPAPDEVFAILEDREAYPCWRSGLDAIEVQSDSRFVESASGDDVPYEVVEREPGRKLVVRIADPDLPYGGQWTYALEPRGSGTALTITEAGFVDNLVMRGIASLFMDPAASIEQFQADLLAHRTCD